MRPAAESVRERLFSSLGDQVAGSVFLDLFAGTGSYGLEAISRGATCGAFVEQNMRAIECIRRNLSAVCKSAGIAGEDFEVVRGDALRRRPTQSNSLDLVFADPPYPMLEEIAPKLFAGLLNDVRVNEKTLLALELPGEVDLNPEGWRLERRLGKTRRGSPTHALFRRD